MVNSISIVIARNEAIFYHLNGHSERSEESISKIDYQLLTINHYPSLIFHYNENPNLHNTWKIQIRRSRKAKFKTQSCHYQNQTHWYLWNRFTRLRRNPAIL